MAKIPISITKQYHAPAMEHIKEIIPRTTAGSHLKCKFCSDENALIQLIDRRYKVFCPVCQSEYYLKEQHLC